MSPIQDTVIKTTIAAIANKDLLPVGFYAHEYFVRGKNKYLSNAKSSQTVRFLHISPHAWCTASFKGKSKAVNIKVGAYNKFYFHQPNLQVTPQVWNSFHPNKFSPTLQAAHVQFFTASTYHVYNKSKWLKWLTENLDINAEICKEDIALIPSLTNNTKFALAIVVCSQTEQTQ